MRKGYLRKIMENNELINKKVHLQTYGCQMDAVLDVLANF